MLQGGPGFCQIAVTNACNAHCRFCSFPRVAPAARVMADPARLFRGLAALTGKGVNYLCFTGGEPLLYPDAAPGPGPGPGPGHPHHPLHQRLPAHPGLYPGTPGRGPGNPDHFHGRAHRRRPMTPTGACRVSPEHIREMLPEMRRAGLNPVASVTLSRLIGDLGEMLRFLEEPGVSPGHLFLPHHPAELLLSGVCRPLFRGLHPRRTLSLVWPGQGAEGHHPPAYPQSPGWP